MLSLRLDSKNPIRSEYRRDEVRLNAKQSMSPKDRRDERELILKTITSG